MKRINIKRTKQGFTLIEVMLAVAILVVGSTMMLNGFMSTMNYSTNTSVYARSASENYSTVINKVASYSNKDIDEAYKSIPDADDTASVILFTYDDIKVHEVELAPGSDPAEEKYVNAVVRDASGNPILDGDGNVQYVYYNVSGVVPQGFRPGELTITDFRETGGLSNHSDGTGAAGHEVNLVNGYSEDYGDGDTTYANNRASFYYVPKHNSDTGVEKGSVRVVKKKISDTKYELWWKDTKNNKYIGSKAFATYEYSKSHKKYLKVA